jgi:septum formation protein
MAADFVLASASPRRRRLLGQAGFHFAVDPSGLDERVFAGETPLLATSRLACEKAAVVGRRWRAGTIVLGADTSVVCDGTLFGKPTSPAGAVDMLLALSGRNHQVLTCWALLEAGAGAIAVTGVTASAVRMREIGRDEARAYVDSGEPLDKAGAYAVQGLGRRLVAAVLGSLDNVIGLPVAQVSRALAGVGVTPRSP